MFAIEKNEADHAIARRNHAAFGVSNYTLQHGKAPEGPEDWPDPDAVFIGGLGRRAGRTDRAGSQGACGPAAGW